VERWTESERQDAEDRAVQDAFGQIGRMQMTEWLSEL
jgi:hypothetical protein